MGRHALLLGIDRYPGLPGKDLAGCVNDVALLASILRDRFDFAPGDVVVHTDEAVTRRGVLAAFDALIGRVSEGDVVVVVFAGHGSRVVDPEGSGMLESMVTFDSGRGSFGPNRDVLDYEIDDFVQRLNRATPHVTLLVDCCHSGSVTRDAFGGATREIDTDTRSLDLAFPEGLPPRPALGRRGVMTDAAGAGGWIPGSRTAVVVAACDAAELANEHRVEVGGQVVRHGALSFFLGEALLHAAPGATWRDVFEAVAPRITAQFPRQHPQLEGKADTVLFAATQSRPSPYLPVLSVVGDRVELGGGAAHGVAVGAEFALLDGGAHHDGGPERGRVTIDTVGAARSWGRGSASGSWTLPLRAFVRAGRLGTAPLRVAVAGEGVSDTLRAALAARAVLELVPEGDADVLLRLVPARAAVPAGAPLPGLGPLSRPTWAGVGGDGRLVIEPIPEGPGAADHLADHLVRVARFRNLVGLRSPDPCGRLACSVRFDVLRFAPARGGFVSAGVEGDGLPRFEEGEGADFVVTSEHDAALFLSVLEFGADGAIALLAPADGHPDGPVRLEPGARFSLREHYESHPEFDALPEGLPLHLPEGFPYAAESDDAVGAGVVTLKLLVTTEPVDFSFLEQGHTRDLRETSHPLEDLVAPFGGGGTRSFKPKRTTPVDAGWAVFDRPLAVARPGGRTFDGALEHEGVTLAAPGLAGRVTFRRGEGARTRDLGGSSDPFEGAMAAAGLRPALTIEIDAPVEAATRSLGGPVMPDGQPAMELCLPDAGDCAQIVLCLDESGALHVGLPERRADGTCTVMLPRRVAQASAAPGTRSIAYSLAKKTIKVFAYTPLKAAVDLGARHGVAAWEDRARPYGLRRFGPDDFTREEAYEGGGAWTRADWSRLGEGPALLFVHGTFSRSWVGFGGLDRDTMVALHDLYGGRVFAFDHPTLSVDPDENLRWFLDQMPPGGRLELDLVTHSRGGLLGRVFAARGPAWSRGRLQVRRVVMAGTPNAGTPMAESRHLRRFVEVLLNTINAFPVPGPQDLLQGVLELLKFAGAGTIDALPGLRSMLPGGEFLRRLDAEPAGAALFGMASGFGPGCPGWEDLAEGFRAAVVTQLQDGVFGASNDLVVPEAGVSAANGSAAFPLAPDSLLVFGQGGRPGIEHSGYFARPEARERLLVWLRGSSSSRAQAE